MPERTPRILFCSHLQVTKTIGTTKVFSEIAEGMERRGWDVTLQGPEQLRSGMPNPGKLFDWYGKALRDYLAKHASEFDVVEYDHSYLPYPRDEFAAETLMVARSVLLVHHLLKIRIPCGPTLHQRLGSIVRKPVERSRHRRWLAAAHRTVQQADLVNVANEHDRRELIEWGIDSSKIVVIPYGIGWDRRPMFEAVSEASPEQPRVAFVGTFDYRKGAREMHRIFTRIVEAVPKARFKLLGTAGMFQTVEQVLSHFPESLHLRIQVVPRFAPEDLPFLLSDCSVGIFPSRLEGFGIGVLEMLAAAVPVIAYNAPGPPEMLPPEHLVTSGDAWALGDKVIQLLSEPSRLAQARRAARIRSRAFDWADIALTTSNCYSQALQARRAALQGATVNIPPAIAFTKRQNACSLTNAATEK